MATAVAVATAGVGASVLVSGVGASEGGGGCVMSTATTDRVVVSCYGNGGELTVPGGTEVTVALAGASGGKVATTPGGKAGRVDAMWTPEDDTVLDVTLGQRGLPGSRGAERSANGGGGGGASWVTVPGAGSDNTPTLRDRLDWLWVAGGGGGAGASRKDSASGGHGGSPDGGPDEPTEGDATGATQSGPGRGGASEGGDGESHYGGLGVDGGGDGGDGFYGGGGGGDGGGGGGGGSSNAAVGEATYSVAHEPGDGYATFSWTLAPRGTPPEITSAPMASFVVGQPGSFAITATGDPAPELSVGPLPTGLTFTDDGDGSGVISGQPAAGTGGDTFVDVTATNGREPDATQQLQIHITVPSGPQQQPPPPFTPDFTPVETTEAQQQPEPEPELVPVADETIVVVPVSGTVLIRRPDGTVTELKEGEEIPVGSVVDARNGVVRLTAARDATGVVQTAVFWNAIFQVTQQADPQAPGSGARAAGAASKKLLTELTLRQKATDCKTSRRGAHAAASKKKPGGLWGDGKGRFSVRGDSSSATVRGTKWYVENRCEGTYTRVVRGIVAVRDFVKKKTIVLRAGGTYTAKKRGS